MTATSCEALDQVVKWKKTLQRKKEKNRCAGSPGKRKGSGGMPKKKKTKQKPEKGLEGKKIQGHDLLGICTMTNLSAKRKRKPGDRKKKRQNSTKKRVLSTEGKQGLRLKEQGRTAKKGGN